MRPTGCGFWKKLKYLNKKIILTTNCCLWLLILIITFITVLIAILQSNLNLNKIIILDSGIYSQLNSTITIATINLHKYHTSTLIAEEEKKTATYLFFFKSQIDKAISFTNLHEKFNFKEDLMEVKKLYSLDKIGTSSEKEERYLVIENKLLKIVNKLGDFDTFSKNLNYQINKTKILSSILLLIISATIFFSPLFFKFQKKNILSDNAKLYRLEKLGIMTAAHTHNVSSVITGLKLAMSQLNKNNLNDKKIFDKIYLSLRHLEISTKWMHLVSAPGDVVEENYDFVGWNDLTQILKAQFDNVIELQFKTTVAENLEFPIFIEMVLSELFKNSITHGKSEKVLIQLIEKNSVYYFTVQDFGKGIDKKLLKNILEPFITTKEANFGGLGLSSVKEIITSQGGTFSVSSKENEGTQVEFTYEK